MSLYIPLQCLCFSGQTNKKILFSLFLEGSRVQSMLIQSHFLRQTHWISVVGYYTKMLQLYDIFRIQNAEQGKIQDLASEY